MAHVLESHSLAAGRHGKRIRSWFSRRKSFAGGQKYIHDGKERPIKVMKLNLQDYIGKHIKNRDKPTEMLAISASYKSE